ncbi:cysteine synthase CysM [Aeromonas taiwanensis]|uniref:Cysteine synthase n=1 Tax=Aeromonas taiwanensis TaxID=633417 RepID=A0A5F0KBH4_9GAMM|nr:cysteine synthase CysM [Aeromonas taiwanensis]TFF76941.1 cysteine synthase CysM [Aeromonas taiwanensis]TFF77638.1 cysteine synthase CysM [Aeromonas taiwanensis]TFF81597.1 cysteine synthase CysM [Aeromonas taiwanensis]
MAFATLEDLIGNTPLLALRRINPYPGVTLLVKLEGNNPAGSVKDRPALNLIRCAEASGHLAPGARLIEATSGNTGIALAMVAAARGYRMRLIMPDTMSQERRDAMQAYGAELVLVEGGMEAARDLALAMQGRGEGLVLDQFNNPANPDAHYLSTGPEIWRQSGGAVTHFVSAMGTTGTIMGVSRYLKEQNPAVEVIGLQPAEGSQIPGIRRWPEAYLPAIFEPARVDRVLDVTLDESLAMMRRLAREEGICCGVSSGGAVAGALRVAAGIGEGVVVAIICDRGDRYLSTGVFTPAS